MVKTKVVKTVSVFVFLLGLLTLIGICGGVEQDTMSIQHAIYIASVVIVLLAIDTIIIRWIQREEGGGEGKMYDMHEALERERFAENYPEAVTYARNAKSSTWFADQPSG